MKNIIPKENTILQHLVKQEEISLLELQNHIILLIPAAIDTTNRLIANCLYILGSNPSVLNEISNSQDIENFVLEVCRFESPIHSTLRCAVNDATILGCDISRRGLIVINLAAANRDPAVFSDPEKFNLHRKEKNYILTFGYGKHQCLGRSTALSEVAIVISKLLKKFKSFEILDKANTNIQGQSFRAPNQLILVAR